MHGYTRAEKEGGLEGEGATVTNGLPIVSAEGHCLKLLGRDNVADRSV